MEPLYEFIPLMFFLWVIVVAWVIHKIETEKFSPPPNPILECHILSYAKKQLKRIDDMELDEDPDEYWVPFAIDLRSVIGIKPPAEGERDEFNIQHDRCALYTETDSFVVKVPFYDVHRRWIEIRKHN